jgi:predicted AAA+ superfamily ATPase
MAALSNRSFNELRNDPEAWGRLVEVAVGSHLVNDGSKSALEVYYWREGNIEVDYVLRKGKKLLAIEVKSGRKKASLAGLAVFAKRFNGTKTLVVGSGGIGIEQFLTTPVMEWF